MRPSIRFVESRPPACRFPRPEPGCCVGAEAALALAADAERAGDVPVAKAWEKWAFDVEEREREEKRMKEEAERVAYREGAAWQARRYGL